MCFPSVSSTPTRHECQIINWHSNLLFKKTTLPFVPSILHSPPPQAPTPLLPPLCLIDELGTTKQIDPDRLCYMAPLETHLHGGLCCAPRFHGRHLVSKWPQRAELCSLRSRGCTEQSLKSPGFNSRGF